MAHVRIRDLLFSFEPALLRALSEYKATIGCFNCRTVDDLQIAHVAQHAARHHVHDILTWSGRGPKGRGLGDISASDRV